MDQIVDAIGSGTLGNSLIAHETLLRFGSFALILLAMLILERLIPYRSNTR